jgi:hypothetical protein
LLVRGDSVKISGFSLTRKTIRSEMALTALASSDYSAPELMQTGFVDRSSERMRVQREYLAVGNLGALLLFMLGGERAVRERNSLFASEADAATFARRLPDLLQRTVSSKSAELLFALLQPDPAKRITWSTFVEHPYWYDSMEISAVFASTSVPQAAAAAASASAIGLLPSVSASQTFVLRATQVLSDVSAFAIPSAALRYRPPLMSADDDPQWSPSGSIALRSDPLPTRISDLPQKGSQVSWRQEPPGLLSPSSSFVGALKAAHVTSELRAQVLMHASSAAANNPASAVMEPPPECALTGEQRLLLRRLLISCMMLGATRAQSEGLLGEAAPSLDAIKAFAADEAAMAVGAHPALRGYEGLLQSAHLIAFHLQLLVDKHWSWLQPGRGDETASSYAFSGEDARFFQLVHASVCRLHVTASAAAVPFSLLHFFGNPLVNELRAECIRHLNTKGTAHRRHAVDILAILLKLWITPSATPQGREQWIQNLERSRALSSNARARMRAARTALILTDKPQRNGFIHEGSLYPVQRIPWTNLKLVDAVRKAVGAPNDKESFQLDSGGAQQVDKAAAVAAGKEAGEEWRRMPGAPTPEELVEAEAMKRA